MLVKTDIPQSLKAGIQTAFMKEFMITPSQWSQIAMVITSTKSEETYAWLGTTPKMREWKDERLPKALIESHFTIINRKWEASLAVDREALEDEQYGQITVRAQELGVEAKRHPDELIFSLLQDGFATTGATGDLYNKVISCYDALAFFSASHVDTGAEYSTVQSNLGTTALGAASLKTGITAMRGFKDDRGRVKGISPNVLVVPPALEWTARELLNSTFYPGEGTTTNNLSNNVLKGTLSLIVSPYLTDANNWFLLDTTRKVKPLIFQMRVPMEFTALEGGSEHAFKNDEYLYGIRSRYNVGFGDWRYAYGAQVT